MDLVLISLIFRVRPFLLGGLFFLSISCSLVSPKQSDEADIQLTEELDALTKKVENINWGPTVKSSAPFVDKTADYGLDGLQAVTLNAVDFNLDGKTDLVLLPNYYSRPKFFVFNPALKKFRPWKHDPLPADFKASFLLFYDVNKDNIIDLISVVLNQRSEVSQMPIKLYLGSVSSGYLSFNECKSCLNLPPSPSSSLTLIDYNLDGWVDVFIGNWFENKDGKYLPVADRLLKNNKGKFEDVSEILQDETKKNSDQLYPPLAKPTYGSASCDVDQNGFPDILTVSSSGHKNKLWMNLKQTSTGERFFEDLGGMTNYGSDSNGNLIPTGGGRNFFSACTDYNNDGIMDIFLGSLSHAYDNDSVDRSSILTGSKQIYPPYFIRTEYLSDVTSEAWNQGDRRGVWVDYNLDGRIDLLVDNSGFPPYSRLVMFEQDESHAFVNVGPQLGIDIVNPSATIAIDVNQDGLIDFITSQNNIRRADIVPRLYLFENQVKVSERKAIRVYLRGIKSNTEALGATVMLLTKRGNKKLVQKRWLEYSQGGLTSQNEEGIHFGVDQDTKVIGLKVRWPFAKKDGFKQGEIVEKLYSLKGYMNKDYVEITVCEDGKILTGKMSCQF